MVFPIELASKNGRIGCFESHPKIQPLIARRSWIRAKYNQGGRAGETVRALPTAPVLSAQDHQAAQVLEAKSPITDDRRHMPPCLECNDDQ